MLYQILKDEAWTHRKKLEKIDKITWIALGILEILLILRLAYNLVSPESQSAFGVFVHRITSVIIAPFGILFGVSSFRYSMFELVTLLSMAAYAVACWIVLNINGTKMANITLHYQWSEIQPVSYPAHPFFGVVKSDDVKTEDDDDDSENQLAV